jgi:hypothetical protein
MARAASPQRQANEPAKKWGQTPACSDALASFLVICSWPPALDGAAKIVYS